MKKPFHQLHHESKAQAVNDFRIWRAGQSVGWNCTASDIAEETGLHVVTVRDACRRRGWKLVSGRDAEYFAGRPEIDVAMRARDSRIGGRV